MLEVPLLLFADRSSWSTVLLLGKQMRKDGGGGGGSGRWRRCFLVNLFNAEMSPKTELVAGTEIPGGGGRGRLYLFKRRACEVKHV